MGAGGTAPNVPPHPPAQAGVPAPAGAPCGECRSCRKAVSGNHPDLRVLGRDTATISISEVRELQREIALAPVEGRYRVFVLPDFGRASLQAANALLKTLEEPPGRAILILTAQEPAEVLPTILSRCQALQLRPVPAETLVEGLRRRGAEPDAADRLTRLALGRPGWALQALHAPELLRAREEKLGEILRAMDASLSERLAAAEALGRNAATALEYVGLAETWWREALLRGEGHPRKAASILRRLLRTRELLQAYVNPRLAMEHLLLNLA